MSNMQEKFQQAMAKMSNNVVIKSITHGMMGIIPISIGVCIVSILINLPIQPWLDLLANVGITGPANELLAATTSMLAIYTVISVSYSYAKNVGQDPKATSILATAAFIVLMPQTITVGESSVKALLSSNLGSDGIFIAIIVGILVGWIYDLLIKHNVKINMPEQVPPMVVSSMTPIIGAMIIFTGTFLIKWGLTLTSFGDIFTLFKQLLTGPAIVILGNSAFTPVLYCILRAIFWFFGIHPSPLNAVFLPISAACTAANVDAFLAGQSLPYLEFTILTSFGLIGGTGSTFGLSLNMFKAKSERYKALNKVAFIPNLFNINEPYVFGVPIMYNITMLIPMIINPIVGWLIAKVFLITGLINSTNLNPTVSAPWVLPYPIAAFLRGGIWFCVAVLVCIVVQTLIWRPFFKIQDNAAYKEEQQLLAEENKAA